MIDYKPLCREEQLKLSQLLSLCRSGKYDLIEEYLSDYPHFLNARDTTDMGLTAPIHACCSHGHYRCVKMLLQLNANLKVIDKKGRTPFHLACKHGHLKMAKLIFSRGGSVTDLDFGGNSALHLALKSRECTFPMIRFLLERGSDPCQVDNNNETPHDIVQKIYERMPSEDNLRVLEVVEKYLPIYVDDFEREKDSIVFSVGLGVAIGMIMKLKRQKQKKKEEYIRRKKERQQQLEDERRSRPAAVRKRMFDKMATMKKRRDYRIRRMQYVFPQESDLSSLPVDISKEISEDVCVGENVPEDKPTKTSSGQRITKYM